jgi:hypothetical protein
MDRQVFWQAWTGVGLESCRIRHDAAGVWAESVALGVEEDQPWALRYTLRGDTGWRTRELSVVSLGHDATSLRLIGDGAGRWTGPAGERLPQLDGCLDVDLTSSVFTNTLSIRRLGLAPGRSEETTVVYVTVPGLGVSISRQRYRCLASAPDGARYRFEAPASGFVAEISVDRDGLVVDYPGIARRVWAR